VAVRRERKEGGSWHAGKGTEQEEGVVSASVGIVSDAEEDDHSVVRLPGEDERGQEVDVQGAQRGPTGQPDDPPASQSVADGCTLHRQAGGAPLDGTPVGGTFRRQAGRAPFDRPSVDSVAVAVNGQATAQPVRTPVRGLRAQLWRVGKPSR